MLVSDFVGGGIVPLATARNHFLTAVLRAGRGTITLRKLVQRLKETYCGPIGWEFMHIPDVEQCNFLRERVCCSLSQPFCLFQPPSSHRLLSLRAFAHPTHTLQIELKESRKFSREEKLTILDRLTWADHFEVHTHTHRAALEDAGGTLGCAKLLRCDVVLCVAFSCEEVAYEQALRFGGW
jgi:hypothetical protein